VNLALSFAGLRVLPGVGNLTGLPQTFRANRVPGAAPSEALGDIHALLIVAADQAPDLDVELDRQRERMAACGVDEVTLLRGETLPGAQRGHEHFGFKDGISQPAIVGTTYGNGPPVAAGEFILGRPDQTGQPSGGGLPDWTRNGSFLAFLQLQQHVTTFWRAMRQQAQQFDVQPEDVAAWIVGRKRDAEGTPVVPPPGAPERLSHIGRAYARWRPPAEASRHRIIRRGIPYGPVWIEGQLDHDPRGLLFVAYQADIERQFEFVLTQWLGKVEFPVPAAGTDALVGQLEWPGRPAPNSGRTATAEWTPRAQRPASTKRAGQTGGIVSLRLPAFVTPRFGGYFFSPGIDALSQIARRGTPTSSQGGLP
jgi:Dyp-type peroxidase family